MKFKSSLQIICIVLLLSIASLFVQIKTFQSQSPKTVVSVVKVLLYQKYASFWDDVMSMEGQKLQKESENERINFYLDLLVEGINIESNGQASMVFYEMVGSDALLLKSKLLIFKTIPAYQKLAEDKKKSIEYWIGVWDIESKKNS